MSWFSRIVAGTLTVASSFAMVQAPVLAADLPPVVRIVVPLPPGNSVDAIARALAENLSQVTKSKFIVDNKPGAGGLVGSAEVARANPDGSVLLFTTGGHTTNPVLHRKLPYDPLRDFTPITQVDKSDGFLLLVRADSPYQSIEQLLQAARAKPGTISFGSFGTGNPTHLVGELFSRSAGISLMHVPYKASPIPDFLGGHIELLFPGTSPAQPLLEDGKVRALATSNDVRIASLPKLPTFAELGIKNVNVPAWNGLLGPAGMQPSIVDALHKAVGEAVKRDEYKKNVQMFAVSPVVSSPKQFSNYLVTEIARFKTLLAPLNIQLD